MDWGKAEHLPQIFLVCATVLSYWNSLPCQFTFDDSSAIVDNEDLRPHTPLARILENDFWGMPLSKEESHKSYRPITVLTFRLNYLFHGLEPFGYHLVNLLLHIGVSLYYDLVLRRILSFSRTAAFQASLLFALHPVHTEAVAGVVGRAELLSAFFFLLALSIFSSSAPKIVKTPTAVIFGFIATFCKEQGFTTLGLCAAYEIVFSRQSGNRVGASKAETVARNILRKWNTLAALIGGTIMILTVRVLALKGGLPRFTEFDNPASVIGSTDRQLTYNYLLALNTWIVLCPDWLCADWTMGTLPPIRGLSDYRNLATVLFYAVLFRLGLKSWQNQWSIEGKRMIFCGLWTVLPFIPSSNLFFPVGFVIAERVLYIPSMGFCALLMVGYSKLLIRSRHSQKISQSLQLCFAFICVVFGIKTALRCKDWTNDWTLFRSALSITGMNAKVFNNLGHYLEQQSNYSEALKYFQRASEVQPNDIGAWVNIGRTYKNLNSLGESEEAFLRAKSLMPKVIPGQSYTAHLAPSSLKVYLNLGNLYRNQSKLNEAAEEYLEAIRLLPNFVAAYQNLGDVYMAQGKLMEAKGVFIQGLQYAPTSHELRYNLGILEAQRGRKEAALDQFDEALKLNPNHFESLLNSAHILSELPNLKLRAIGRARQALHVRPDMAVLHRLLGTLLYETGERLLALESFRSAVRLNPTSKSGFLNLGLIQAELGKREEARENLEAAMNLEPGDNRARLSLCELFVNGFKNTGSGRRCYETALIIDPESVQARHNLCVLLIDIKSVAEAKRCIGEAQQLLKRNQNYSIQHLNVLKSRFNDLVQ